MTDYEYYKSHGICFRCRHADTVPGEIYCPECKEIIRAYSNERHQRNKAAGICITCGKRPVWREGSVRCRECMDKLNESRQKLQAERSEAGICIRCGKVPARPGRQMCAECATQRNKYSREYYAKHKKEVET